VYQPLSGHGSNQRIHGKSEDRMKENYQYIGKHVNRSDGKSIVSGRTEFLDDIRLPGMLCCRVLRSPYPHANIKNIDVSRATALPGVKAALTWKDVPDWKCGLPPHRKTLDSRVRFVGDSVAIVAAESREIAEEAVKLIDVEYEVLPFVLDCEEAQKEGAPQLYEQFPGNEIPAVTPFSKEPFKSIMVGDVKQGFAESAYVAEGYFCYDGLPHPLPPESPGVIAKWTSPVALTVYYNGAAPHLQKFNTEASIPGVAVRVIACHAGGSYGSKQLIPHMVLQAASLAQVTGRPVKFIMDRTDHFNTYELRQGSRIRGKVGMTKDGIVNAIEGMWYTDSGMSSTYAQAQTAVGLGEAQAFLGKCKNWALDSKLIATNHSSQAPIRGFGGQELKAALIPLVCTAIRAANMDPFEVFKKNFVSAGDSYIWRDYKWWDVKSVNYRPAMDASAEKFGWKNKWKGWEIPTWVSPDGRKAVGVGVGVHGNADIGEDPTEAFVKLHPFGSITVECCIGESGGAQRHAAQKMAAEVMNVPFDGVQIVASDTHGTPYDAGLIGSRGTITIGTAVVRATKDARRKLLDMASKKLDMPAEMLDTENFMVFIKDKPEVRLPWIAVTGTPEMTITGVGLYEQDFSKPNFAMYFAEVEVDLETGEAKLLRALEGTDVGQIIDPINLKMQAQGSFGAAGADTALFEEIIIDQTTGRIVNGNMIDYKWRTFNEFPPFDFIALESKFDSESFHAVGFGEISGSPAPSAILMAISNAIGAEITEYPATPHVILKAMGKVK
jgi:xanthine dehydrogenase molybdenum-binding subunit